MASNATIYKALLQIADMDRQHFQDHALTLARHPSETEERMMVRVLAFALHADEALSFGRGVGTEDEPALWQRDLTGSINCWIEIASPTRRPCARRAAAPNKSSSMPMEPAAPKSGGQTKARRSTG